MQLKQTTADVLRQLNLMNEAQRVRNRYRRAKQRNLLRVLARLYSDGKFGRNASYRAWQERLREEDMGRARERQRRDMRFLVELALRHGLAPLASKEAVDTRSLSEVLAGAKSGAASSESSIVAAWAALTALVEQPSSSSLESVTAAANGLLGELPELEPAERLALMNAAGKPLVESALDQLIDAQTFPHAYEYDYIDDFEQIVRSRSATGALLHVADSERILRAVAALSSAHAISPNALRASIGAAGDKYAPLRGPIGAFVRTVIPDLVDEFVAMRACERPARFLEINREYSRRQRDTVGSIGPSGLSLLFGYERETHLMVRTLLELVHDKRLATGDEVLVIGPRHADELEFFRRELGLKPTGLDLFDAPRDGIVAGDMHHMNFASGRFKLVYCCSTLSYSYAIRNVISEIARVCARPGYVILSDAGNRVKGVDPLGRSDPMNTTSMLSCFHASKYNLLFADEGVPLVADFYHQWPSIGIELY